MQVNIAKNAQTEQKQKSIKNELSFSHIPIQNNLEDPISSDFDIKESILMPLKLERKNSFGSEGKS